MPGSTTEYIYMGRVSAVSTSMLTGLEQQTKARRYVEETTVRRYLLDVDGHGSMTLQ